MSRWFSTYWFDEVADGLLLGAYPQDEEDVAELSAERVSAIFNLVEDSEYERGRDSYDPVLLAAGIKEERLPLRDFGNLKPDEIEHAAQTVIAWLDAGERVYLHCRAGMQRSATVATAVLALRDGVSPLDALQQVSARRPSAEPLAHQREDLVTWWKQRA